MSRIPVLAVILAICVAARSDSLLINLSNEHGHCVVRAGNARFVDPELAGSKLRALAQSFDKNVAIAASSNVPWICIAGTIYKLQGAKFHVTSVKIDGKDLPQR